MPRPPKEKNIRVNPVVNSNTEFDEMAWSESEHVIPHTIPEKVCMEVSYKEEILFSYYGEIKRLSFTGNIPELTKILYKLFAVVYCGSYLFTVEDLEKVCKHFNLDLTYILNTIDEERKAVSQLRL